MDVYKINNIGELIRDNSYVGRGIVIGKSKDGKKAAVAYFIMGRSENSRNRVFVEKGDGIATEAFDPAKLSDPSLVIYSPIKKINNHLIVTNGDQTDTIFEYMSYGRSFEEALESREFEPDAPNFTPRISGLLTFANNNFTYKMSILKSADPEGSACNRFNFSYNSLNGLGHFLHTYNCDGNPIPTFTGEPERVEIPNNIDTFIYTIWDNLNEENKISIYAKYIDLEKGSVENRMINKNK